MTSAAELALQVLLPGFDGPMLPGPVADLLVDGLGGVCLFGSNTAAGPDAVRELTDAIRGAGWHPLVATDEEGGDVTRLHAGSGSPVLGPAALGAVDDLALTRATGRAVGEDLVRAGAGLDLGPVADVNSEPSNPVIGTRSFGADPELVARHVAAWVTGLQDTGVAACVKHFPGHGDTREDSHLESPVLPADVETLAIRELPPFAAAIEAGAAAVMTAHLVVPALDPHLPATLSPAVQSLLRGRLGFDGVVVTDALDMAGASASRGMPEAAVLALVAGADLLCLGPATDPDLVRAVQSAIAGAVDEGRLSQRRLAEAAERVGRLARGERAPAPAAPDPPDAQLAGARRATTVEGRIPGLTGAGVVTVASAPTIAVGDVSWGITPDHTVRPGADLRPHLERPLVVQVRDAHRHPEVARSLAAVADAAQDVVVVEWGWPGPRTTDLPRICPRGWSVPGLVAVTELLRQAGWDR